MEINTQINIEKKNNRSNCGRKKVADKKIQLYVFVRQSVVDSIGGKEATKRKMLCNIEHDL